MSILDKIKDSSNNYLKVSLQILTPLEYVEYVCKMLLVIDFKKVEIFLLSSIVINVVLMFSGLIFNIGISKVSLVVSCVINSLVYVLFTSFRKSKAKKTVTNYEIGEVKVKPLVVEDFEIPDSLRRYVDNKNDLEPKMPVAESNLNNLLDTSSVNLANEKVSKPIELKPAEVDDLDLSSFNYEEYFKER